MPKWPLASLQKNKYMPFFEVSKLTFANIFNRHPTCHTSCQDNPIIQDSNPKSDLEDILSLDSVIHVGIEPNFQNRLWLNIWKGKFSFLFFFSIHAQKNKSNDNSYKNNSFILCGKMKDKTFLSSFLSIINYQSTINRIL